MAHLGPMSDPSFARMKPTARHDAVDALRGLAMLWMTAYHFGFDLNHFGYWRQDFYADPLWTTQRSAIVSLFLFCAGLGQAIALAQRQDTARFWRRWGQVAGCALLVSLSSWWMFPNSFIYFGVLHGIAVMLLLARFALGPALGQRGWLLCALGALAVALHALAPLLWGSTPLADALNTRPLSWLGLNTVKPITEDFVPLLPWLGPMLLGLAAGNWLLRRRPGLLAAQAPAPLAWLGRHSLSYYMLHQPVLMGVLMGLGWLRGAHGVFAVAGA